MNSKKAGTSLPADHFKAELRKLGRSLEGAVMVWNGWKDGQYVVHLAWEEFSAFISLGDTASALIEQRDAGRLH